MNDIISKLKNSTKNLFVGMAGPGAGKSHTFRIIIESDEFKGKNILILSFINKLVDDLKEDFKDFDNVKVSTLHAFARSIIAKSKGNLNIDQNLDKIITEDHYLMTGDNLSYEEKFYENSLSADETDFYKKRKDFLMARYSSSSRR